MQALIQLGADVNAETEVGTVAGDACSLLHQLCCPVLPHAAPCCPYVHCWQAGFTPLFMASVLGKCVPCSKLLLKAGASTHLAPLSEVLTKVCTFPIFYL